MGRSRGKGSATRPGRLASAVVFAIVASVIGVVASALVGPERSPRSFHVDGKIRLSEGPREGALPVTAAEGQIVYAAWQDASFSYRGTRIAFAVSNDGGREFGETIFLGGGQHPAIAAAGDRVFVAWSQASDLDGSGRGANETWVTDSADRGRSFGTPTRLDDDDAHSLDAALAATDAGAFVAWADLSGDVYVSRFVDIDEPWERTWVGTDFRGENAPAVAAFGANVVVAWREDVASGGEVLVAASTDNGASFEPPVRVSAASAASPARGVGVPRVAVSEADVFVVWDEMEAMAADGSRDAGARSAMIVVSSDAGATYAAPRSLGKSIGFGQVSVAARRGLAAAVWSGFDGVYVASSADAGLTFSPPRRVALTEPESYPEVAIARDQGGPRAAFDWSVRPRFGLDEDSDGVIDYRTDSVAVAKPEVLATTLDGCASTPDGPGPMMYEWVVDDQPAPEQDCSIVRDLSPGAVHVVSLRVSQGSRSHVSSHDVVVDDRLVVSIGDSVASGEGNPDVPGSSTWPWSPNARWQDLQCNRSANAGPALAARYLEDHDPHTSVTFVHLACSGAKIADTSAGRGGLLSPYQGINPGAGAVLPPQVDQMRTLVGTRPIDALLVSIGANDVRLSEIVVACLAGQECTTGQTPADFASRLAGLPARYGQLAAALQELVPPERVFLSEYFDPTMTETGAFDLSCVGNPLPGISDTAARWASREVVARLNAAVADAASAHRWNLVGGIASELSGHGYCAVDPWIVQLGQSFAEQDSENGAFHPNIAGHEVYGAALERAVADRWQTIPSPPSPTGVPDELGDVYLAWTSDLDVEVATLVQGSGGLSTLGIRDASQTEGDGAAGDPSLTATDRGAWVVWTEHLDTPDTSLDSYQAFAASAAAGPPNLAIASVGLVQSPSRPYALVAQKSTAVEAEIDSTFATDQWSLVRYRVFDAAGALATDAYTVVLLHPGANRVFLHSVLPLLPENGDAWTAVVEVDPTGQIPERIESDNERASQEIAVAHSRRLKLLYVPVAAEPCAGALDLEWRSRSFVEGVLPLADGDLLQSTGCALALTLAGESTALGLLGQLDTLARLFGYDQAVGVTPMGWLSSHWAPGTIGLALHPIEAAPTAGVLVEHGSVPAVVAHELAHAFGQAHVAAGALAAGYWPAVRLGQDGRDLMNPTLVDDPWMNARVFETLRRRLAATPGDPPVLVVRGTIDADGAVTAGPWHRQEGLLDAPLGADGTLTLEYRSTSGTVLATVGFGSEHVATLGAAIGPPGTDPADGVRVFSARVPDLLPGTGSLALREGSTVLYTRTVSPNTPTVAFTAPAGGERFPAGAAITATVAASDADGGTLAHTLAVSSDGGATWRPLAMDLVGDGLTFTATPDLVGSDVRLRVLTSDGVNTAIAESSSFVVEGGAATEQRVAYVRNLYGSPHASEIWRMNADGTDPQPVTLPVGYYGHPVWSPDGSKIAFASAWSRSGAPDGWIAVAAADGSGLTELDPHPGTGDEWTYDCPEWSPDGARLSFVADQVVGGVGTARQIMTIAADGTDPAVVVDRATSGLDLQQIQHSTLSASRGAACPRWSPDGTRLAFVAKRTYTGTPMPSPYYRPSVYDVGADGTDLRRLWEGYDVAAVVDWSPDGTRLLFEPWAYVDAISHLEIWSIAADGSDARALATSVRNGGTVRLSPDGTRLYYARESETEPNRYELAVMNLDGSGLVTFAPPSEWDYLDPSWRTVSAAPDWPPLPEPQHLADAGGPYRATAGVPITLGAGRSALAQGERPLAEWDLDGDGAYDDATGLSPRAVFAAPGSVTVAVRLTTSTGESAISDPATIVVSPAPPRLAPASHLTVAVAMGITFDLAAVDGVDAGVPTVTVDWGDGARGTGEVTAGRVRATHAYAETGEREIDVWVCGADGPCAETTIAVTIVSSVSANVPPVAHDVAVRTQLGARVTLPLDGTDPDGNPIFYRIVTAPAHGRADELPDGTATYAPDPDFVGVDQLAFVADDGRTASSPATATITVGNQPPILGADALDVPADVPTEIPASTLLANDQDPEGTAIVLAGVYADAPAELAVERTATGARVVPAPGFTGQTTFSYGITDDEGGFGMATVSVTVTVAASPPTGGGAGGGCSCEVASAARPRGAVAGLLLLIGAAIFLLVTTARGRRSRAASAHT